MTDEEVNKIIAEFMGGIPRIELKPNIGMPVPYYYQPLFTQSLDALVPVWDKCGLEPMFDSFTSNSGKTSYQCWFNVEGKPTAICETRQKSAAHATAKAIEIVNK